MLTEICLILILFSPFSVFSILKESKLFLRFLKNKICKLFFLGQFTYNAQFDFRYGVPLKSPVKSANKFQSILNFCE